MGNPLRAAGSDDYSTLENDDSAGSAKRRRRSRWMLALAVISLCALARPWLLFLENKCSRPATG